MSARIASILPDELSRRASTCASDRCGLVEIPALECRINLASSAFSSRRRSVTAISIRVSMRASAALSDGVLVSSMIALISFRAAVGFPLDLGVLGPESLQPRL